MSRVLYVFSAPWCGPCKMMKPIFEQVSAVTGVELKYIDIEQHPDEVATFGVRAVPTAVLHEDGKERVRVTGSMKMVDLVKVLGL